MPSPSLRPPRFRVFHVLLVGSLTFLFMDTFFQLFIVASDMLDKEALHIGPGHAPPPEPPWSLVAHGAILILGLIGAWVYHGPLIRTFRRLRRGQTADPMVLAAAQRRVYRSPLVLGVGLPVFLGVTSILSTLTSLPVGGLHHGMPPNVKALPLLLLFLTLAGFFLFLWQRHRVQTLYVTWLFPLEDLATRLPPTRERSIGKTLLFMGLLATFLPLAVVLVLVATGITSVPDPSTLTADQWSLLLGSTTLGGQASQLIDRFQLQNVPILLINTLDTWRILLGTGLGLVVILTYVFRVMYWTSSDLSTPLYRLRDAMKRVEDGDFSRPEPVVSSNEIGQVTLGFNRMLKGLSERDRIKGLFGQYLTAEVSEAILDGRVKLGGDRYEVTVMFTDIRDFTGMSESLTPEEVFAFLNQYLDTMIEVLVARGGYIDKFIGDGILSVFGLPVRTTDHALQAFEAARDMRRKLDELNAARSQAGHPAIAIGSGLHTGTVIAGNVGSSRKLQFTVIGDTVNLASRIESLNKRYGSSLLLSQATWDGLPETLRSALPFKKEEQVEIRGKKEPVTLYQLD